MRVSDQQQAKPGASLRLMRLSDQQEVRGCEPTPPEMLELLAAKDGRFVLAVPVETAPAG
jgi:hypothetical protein